MLDKIYEEIKYVSDNSKYVKINYEVIDKYINSFTKCEFWLSNNPFNILDLECKDIINFLLIYHTLGFSFWGNPKWTINTDNGKLDGSYALMYLVLNRYKSNKNFNMSFELFEEFLKGNTEIPLLSERYSQLIVMNKYLNQYSFYEEIKNMSDDITLFNYIVSNFEYFEDKRTYKDRTICFYKRAQLLTSDILHVRNIIEKVEVDYSHLVGCSDYKIPQVMNSLGMLEYTKELDKIIENLIPIEVNSQYEVEIRANTLIVIDYIYKKLNHIMSKIDINDYIWLLGQNKEKVYKPYHRTRTINY